MSPKLEEITLVLGVDACHLHELRYTWPTWMRFKPELLRMPAVVFFDPLEVSPQDGDFLKAHPNLRWVPWQMRGAQTQREEMITGWVHVPASEVQTPWYLKLDTDVVATGAGPWMKEEWFRPDKRGEAPVFVSSKWGFSKPRYVINLLDDWADHVPALSRFPRLELPYDTQSNRVRHKRIISWIFFGRTDWTREVVAWLGPDKRLPHASQDTFLFYCARRSRRYYVRDQMGEYHWRHARLRTIRQIVSELPQDPASPELNALSDAAAVPNRRQTVANRGRQGVLYYNVGTSCAVRLLVSLFSLRRHYSGPVTILSEGDHSHSFCRRIAAALDAECQEWDCGVPEGRHRAFLAKTCYHRGTPYDLTIALDADTLVVGPVDELFLEAEASTFCVAPLGGWRSDGRIIGERIREWKQWLPDDIESALNFGPAINCGVVAFQKDAEIFNDWLASALPGRRSFIPDEVACQVILHRYPHRVIDARWNRSCKHDDPDAPDTRIIHFHGRKHCRRNLPFHGAKWVGEFQRVVALNLAGVQQWLPAEDRTLAEYLSCTGTIDSSLTTNVSD